MAENQPVYHLTFVRHGESIGNLENRLQGQADFPLSETGRAQACALAERWKANGVTFDAAISSPLSRALETAQIIAAELGISPLETDPLWLERDMGKHSGLTMAEIRAQSPEPEFVNLYEPFSADGEGDWALFLRAGQALHKLLQRSPGRYLIVTHGAILNQTMYTILGITPQPNFQGARFRFENTAVCRFHYYPLAHRWRVDVIGDTSHLKL